MYVNLKRSTAKRRYTPPYTPIQEALLDSQRGRHCRDLYPWALAGSSMSALDCGVASDYGGGLLSLLHKSRVQSSGVPAIDRYTQAVRAGHLGLGLESKTYIASLLTERKTLLLITNILSPISKTQNKHLEVVLQTFWIDVKGSPETYKVNSPVPDPYLV